MGLSIVYGIVKKKLDGNIKIDSIVSKENPAHVSIIILNWNSSFDTLECLESVLKSSYYNFTIFLLDNSSIDNSVANITNWAKGVNEYYPKTNYKNLIFPLIKKPIQLLEFELNQISDSSLEKIKFSESRTIVFLKNTENSGFAIGNNLIIKLAMESIKSPYFYLLNNDTVIEPNTISNLVKRFSKGNELGVISSLVHNYYNPKKIDQAGGILKFWGKAQYYNNIENEHKITFVNGCAMMVKRSVFEKYGLLSEKFFFGEEDMELSYRMKKNDVKMICISDSKVYHKVGVSAKSYFKTNYKKAFVHRLNRIINMKTFMRKIFWILWKYSSLIYFFINNISKYKINPKKSFLIIVKMNQKANSLNGVSQADIAKIFEEI